MMFISIGVFFSSYSSSGDEIVDRLAREGAMSQFSFVICDVSLLRFVLFFCCFVVISSIHFFEVVLISLSSFSRLQ